MNKIACRQEPGDKRFWYVAQTPGEDGVDWGYVFKAEQAKPLTPYWQRRFRKDCERVNRTARFFDVPRREK